MKPELNLNNDQVSIKVLQLSKKEIEEFKNGNSICFDPFYCNRTFFDWHEKTSVKDYSLINLHGFLKQELLETFGKQAFTFRSEFYYRVWILDFKGYTFSIWTANTKGTCIYIHTTQEEASSPELAPIMIDFYKELMRLLVSKSS